MNNKRYQGENLDGAILEACAELGIPSDKLKYKIVQEGSKGFLGLGIIGARKFIIEVTNGEKDNAKDDRKPKAAFDKSNNDKVKTDRQKFEAPKADNNKDNNNRKTVKDDNVDKSDKNDLKSEQRYPEKRNNKDRFKERPRRFDKENAAEDSAEQPKSRQERRNPDVRNFEPMNTEPRSFAGKNREDNTEETAGSADATRNDRRPETRAEHPVRRYEKTGEVTGDPVKTAEEFLTSLFKSMEMNISYHGEFKSENNELVVDLSGEDMGVLIGKRGQTLDALQYLTSQVVNKHQTAYIRVKIDTENYRERRRETMETLAQNIALKVRKTHKPVALEPMNPYERRIIHSFLQNDKDIITKSEGVEPYRHVIVCPVKKKKSYGSRSREDVHVEEKDTETIDNIKVNDDITVTVSERKITLTESENVNAENYEN